MWYNIVPLFLTSHQKMSDNIKSFGGALLRQAQMKEWKAIPEAERPTWEQFKRGLKVKKVTKKG